jgi:hypothetical protein
MSIEERKKILDKAKKLDALAKRGIGGEKENAYRMLGAYMAKHGITENELKFHRHNEDTFKGLTKEEIYQQFEEEMNMKGLFIFGKGQANIMRNRDKLKQFKGRETAKPVEIEWHENKNNFTFKGFVNGTLIFDLQQTKSGAVLYPTHRLEITEDMEFDSLDKALEYCESMKGYFTDIGL